MGRLLVEQVITAIVQKLLHFGGNRIKIRD